MYKKLISHQPPFLPTPVKLKYFWGREGEVMVIVCTVQVVCTDEAVTIFYIGHQEKYGKTCLSTCCKVLAYSIKIKWNIFKGSSSI